MIRLEQARLPIPYTDADVRAAAARMLRIPTRAIRAAAVLRRSVDARRKPNIGYVASLAVDADADLSPYPTYEPPVASLSALSLPPCTRRVVVVGSGPAGMFAALTLALAGARPTVVERGPEADERIARIDAFRAGGALDPDGNVQFGEGGAGLFSDGKLNTGTSSPLIAAVIGELVAAGAPAEIAIDARPHVGTDKLRAVVCNIRSRIEALGGTYLFGTRMTDLTVRGGRVRGIVAEGRHAGTIDADCVVLAPGHSARDVYEMLARRGVALAPKPFSIGVRIEHAQRTIDRAQYGTDAPPLPAEYRLATHLDGGRGVYTFCMCPGGFVVNASSEAGGIVTNGMSLHARGGANANAALLVGVDGADYGDGLFDGMELQRAVERAAYAVSGSFRAPCQTLGDFARGVVGAFGAVRPTILPTPVPADLHAVLPPFVCDALLAGAKAFGRKLCGFDDPSALLTAPETRSSAPIRILREADGQASLGGLYPAGEGAGYAGGITSSAVDGVRAALAIVGARV